MRTIKAVHEFIDHCYYLDRSPKTISAYEWALGKLLADHATVPRKPEPIMRTIRFNELAPESRHDLWRVFRRFYGYLSNVHDFPNTMEHVPPPRIRPRFPRTLERTELPRVLAAGETRRDRAMVALALDTGVRCGELAGVGWSSITAGAVKVDGKTGERFVPISDHVRHALVGLGDAQHVWVGRQGPLTRSGVELALRRTLRRAGIRPPKAGAHLLRHTFGKLYIMADRS